MSALMCITAPFATNRSVLLGHVTLGDAGSDAGGSGGSELVSQQQPDQQLMNDASEAHFTALNVGVVMF